MSRRAGASELRAEIDRLPLATRQAMLEGIQTNSIIVGADGDPRGGVCPIYAISSPPSRRVGRPFAQAWDAYAGARMPRPASERELHILRSMLETSIEMENAPTAAFDAAIAEHKAAQARSQAASSARRARRPTAEKPAPTPRRDTGERDRTGELSRRHGWAWLRPFRRYEDYERALQMLDGLAEACSEREPDTESERPFSDACARG